MENSSGITGNPYAHHWISSDMNWDSGAHQPVTVTREVDKGLKLFGAAGALVVHGRAPSARAGGAGSGVFDEVKRIRPSYQGGGPREARAASHFLTSFTTFCRPAGLPGYPLAENHPDLGISRNSAEFSRICSGKHRFLGV